MAWKYSHADASITLWAWYNRLLVVVDTISDRCKIKIHIGKNSKEYKLFSSRDLISTSIS